MREIGDEMDQHYRLQTMGGHVSCKELWKHQAKAFVLRWTKNG